MTELDVAKLRSLAECATPGPWAWTGKPGDDEACLDAAGADGYVLSASGMHTEGFVNVEAPDAEFIAATHPATVLALLDRLEQAEADASHQAKRADANLNDMDAAIERAERAEAAIERVRAVCDEVEAVKERNRFWTKRLGYASTSTHERVPGIHEVLAALDTGKEKNA